MVAKKRLTLWHGCEIAYMSARLTHNNKLHIPTRKSLKVGHAKQIVRIGIFRKSHHYILRRAFLNKLPKTW